MHIREIRNVEGNQITLELPQEWKGKRVEIIVLPLEDKAESFQEWPANFFAQFSDDSPDFPDRAPQAELEECSSRYKSKYSAQTLLEHVPQNGLNYDDVPLE
jgi:hypothetical protein